MPKPVEMRAWRTKPNEDTEPRVQLLFIGSWPKDHGAVRLILAGGFVLRAGRKENLYEMDKS